MKKNIFCIILLVFSIASLIFFLKREEKINDTVAPVLTCESDTINASVSITEEELLMGVTAFDNRDGDVSNTIVVQSISNFIKENERIVTYAAIDSHMNVGRIERTLVYTDYKAPTFSLSKPLSYVVGSRVNVLANIRAKSVLDGDITEKIRYGLDTIIDNLTPGVYPVEFRVTDSCGKTSYLNTEIEIYDNSYSGIDVSLSKYVVYVKKNSDFNPEKYYKGSNIEGELSIVNNVNTKKEGTYTVEYFVNGINASGKSKLLVIVY